MRVIILTGMSGAGKSSALNCFEDMGYFCVDNLPPDLIRTFINLYTQRMHSKDEDFRIAINVDIRGGSFFNSVFEALDSLDDMDLSYTVLFLDADDDTLIRRYKETRRAHPLASRSLGDSIALERRMMSRLRERADQVIDTSGLKAGTFKDQLQRLFYGSSIRAMSITVVSFGFKYGLPPDADLIFDARFISNPFYVEDLKNRSGLEQPVSDYVMGFESSRVFLDKLADMLLFLIPQYMAEGKAQMVVAIGCTGGMHRSVVLAECLAKVLDENDYPAQVEHRDLKQEAAR